MMARKDFCVRKSDEVSDIMHKQYVGPWLFLNKNELES